MNKSRNKTFHGILHAEQKARFERAGMKWPGPLCEVQVARLLNDTEFLRQPWTNGECKGSLVVDHISNDNDFNPPDASNAQELCRSHNCKKNPPKYGTRNKFLQGKGLEQSLIKRKNKSREREWIGTVEWKWERDRLMPAPMKKNIESEPKFRKTAVELLNKYPAIKRKDLIDACSERAKCSQQAGGNYLDKMRSEFGPFKYEPHPQTGEIWVMKKDQPWPDEDGWL